MPRKFKEARQINKLKVIEAADKLGISQPTLSAREGERKSPGLDSLENIADLYGVTTDYLLGRSEQGESDPNVPILIKALPIFHGKPVWSAKYGWLLVNAIDKVLLFPDGRTMLFVDCGELLLLLRYFRSQFSRQRPTDIIRYQETRPNLGGAKLSRPRFKT